MMLQSIIHNNPLCSRVSPGFNLGSLLFCLKMNGLSEGFIRGLVYNIARRSFIFLINTRLLKYQSLLSIISVTPFHYGRVEYLSLRQHIGSRMEGESLRVRIFLVSILSRPVSGGSKSFPDILTSGNPSTAHLKIIEMTNWS